MCKCVGCVWVNVLLSKQVAELYAELNASDSSDDEDDTEIVEVERTVIETEVIVDGQVQIKREILEKTKTTHERELHHHSSKYQMTESMSAEQTEGEQNSMIQAESNTTATHTTVTAAGATEGESA